MPLVVMKTVYGLPLELDVDDIVWQFDDLIWRKDMTCSVEFQSDGGVIVIVDDNRYWGRLIGNRKSGRLVRYNDPANPFSDDWI